MRTNTLCWAGGGLLMLLGGMMLVAPHHFGEPVSDTLRPQLPIWGALFIVLGGALFLLVPFGLPRAAALAIHFAAGGSLLAFAFGLIGIGGWTGASSFLVLGLGTALAPLLACEDDERPVARSLFALVVGAGEVVTGLTILALPGEFSPLLYPLVYPYISLFGVAFLASGLALCYVQLRRATGSPGYWLAHVLAGLTLLAFFAGAAVPARSWTGIAYYGGYGLLLVFLPRLEPRLRVFNPKSLQSHLILILAGIAIVPLVLTVALVEEVLMRDIPSDYSAAMLAARDWSFFILLTSVASAVLAGVLIARWLARPLGMLAVAADKLALGEEDVPLPKAGTPEVMRLSLAFGEMRDRLGARTREREQLLAQVQARNDELRLANGALLEASLLAQAAVHERDEFLSVAAHELKTPVTSLRGYAQVLMRQLDKTGELDPARVALALAQIDRQSERLARLVNRLLDLSRIEAGKLVLEKRLTAVAALVEGVVAELRQVYPQRDLAFEGQGEATAAVDPLRLEQVVANLIDNAVKFSPPGSPVEVAVGESGHDTVQIAVRDYGPGIPAGRRTRIFERFYQAQDKEWRGGMGLGLFISRQIVELHGGAIEVECPADGGARFVVRLPAE